MKLKSILDNPVVHTPTEAEAKELLAILHNGGYKWRGGTSLAQTFWSYNKANTCYSITECIGYCYRDWYESKGNPILTLAEFKSKYCEQEKPQPKFKDGDIVLYKGKRKLVYNINTTLSEPIYTLTTLDYQSPIQVEEHCIEPETKPIEGTETVDCPKTIVETQEKELNLCELLRGREGEEIFLTTMGTVIVDGISEENIRFKIHKTAKDTYLLPSNGKMRNSGMVLAFPSYTLYEKYPLNAYTAWMERDKEQKKYVLAIVYNCPEKDSAESIKHLSFRTTADRDQCIEEIKAIIEKYSKK